MHIQINDEKFNSAISYKPELLNQNTDLYNLILPDNISIIVLQTSIRHQPFFDTLKSMMQQNLDNNLYIYPLSPDFGIGHTNTVLVKFDINTSSEEYFDIFGHSGVSDAENFVFATENKNWFICDDFTSNFCYVFYRNDFLAKEKVQKTFDSISIVNKDDILSYIKHEFSGNENVIKLFYKNIISHIQ